MPKINIEVVEMYPVFSIVEFGVSFEVTQEEYDKLVESERKSMEAYDEFSKLCEVVYDRH